MSEPAAKSPGRPLSIASAGLLTALFLFGIEIGLGALRQVLASVGLGRQALIVTFVLGAAAVLAAIAAVVVAAGRALPRAALPTVRLALAAAVAAGTGILLRDLFQGPKASKLPLAAAYPWLLGVLAAAGVDLIVRVARWRRVAGGLLALLVGVTAAVLDARVYPGLYPAFHRYLDFVMLAAIPVGAILVTPALPASVRGPFRLAAFILALAGAGAAWEIGRDPVLAGEIRRAGLVIGRLLPEERTVAETRPADDERDDDPGAEVHQLAADLHRAAVPAAASRPSILLVTIDALRADHGPASPQGAAVTPQLAAWASRGAVFTRAYSAAVSTFPSCRSTLTGRYPDTSEKDTLLPEARVIPAELHALGYHTYFLTGFDILNDADQRWMPALDGAYDEITPGLRTSVLVERARALFRSPAPWFLWMHPREAHLPYEDAGGYAPGASLEARYDAACRYLDSVLGALLREAPDDVWVLLAADHGEDFPAEHGFSSHGASVYESACHVPLVIRGPGVRAARIDHLVSLVDLFPTILGMAGVRDPPKSDGVSLLPAVLRDDAYLGRRDAVFVERRYGNVLDPVANPMRAMVSGSQKIILTEKPRAFEAYDLAQDPKESLNLFLADPDAAHALHAKMNRRFRGRMQRWAAPGIDASLDYDASLGGDPARLVGLASSADPKVRRLAARDLSRAPAAERRDDLLRLAESEDAQVRAWAAVGLGRLATGEEAWPAHLALLGPDVEARESALEILMVSPHADAAPALVQLVDPDHPSLTWKPIAALNRLGHLAGVQWTKAAFREADPMMLGVNSIVAQIGRRPRPEYPSMLEDLYARKDYDITLNATLVAIAAELPSGQMLRLLDKIERGYPQLAPEIKLRRSQIDAAFRDARERYACAGPLPAVVDSVFEVAWEMLPGVNLLVPPESAIRSADWAAIHETYPVRATAKSFVKIDLWRSRGATSRTGFVQLYSLEPGKALITTGGPKSEQAFKNGPNVLPFTLPAVSVDGILSVIIEVEGPGPGRFGVRELVLCPD